MSTDDPTMLFYDEAGQRVPEGPRARRQFLSNDPARPDATPEERQGSGAFGVFGGGEARARTAKPAPAATETKADGSGAGETDPLAARRAIVARAKELGLPAGGKTAELEAAIAEAEAKARTGPPEIKAITSPDENKGGDE